MTARRTVETADYCAMMGRMMRAHARRVAAGSVDDLADLVALRDELTDAINTAAAALHASGVSYTEIAGALGISRQAARQRFTRAAS